MRDTVHGSEIHAVVADFEEDAVGDARHLLTDDLRVDRRGQRLGDVLCCDCLVGPAFRLEGVCAVAQVFSKLGHAVLAHLLGTDGLPDADLHVGALLVEHLMDKAHGAQAGMNPAQEMEELGVRAFEIYGNHRETGVLYHFDDVVRPGLVFHDLFLADGRALRPFLVGAHLSGREESEGAAVVDVLEGHPYALDALGAAALGEVVHGHEAAPEAGDEGEDEGRENPVVRTLGADYGTEDQAVDAAEVMVGNGDESSFFGDAGELFGENFVGGADFLEHGLRELGAVIHHEFLMHRIDLVQFEEAVYAAGYKAPDGSFEAQGVLQFGFRYYVFLLLHIGYLQISKYKCSNF